jgi:hypothetical protein
MMLALGAVEGGLGCGLTSNKYDAVSSSYSLERPGSLDQPLIFTAPQGWKARLTTLDRQIVRVWVTYVKEDPSAACYGGGETFQIIYNDPQGFWLACDVRLEGQTFEVWRETSAWLRLADGQVLYSSRILASADPCGFTLLDNQRWPFVVTQNVHGYNKTVRLYVRFSEEFDLSQVVNWRLVNWVER